MNKAIQYSKQTQVWVWAYSQGSEKIIRPATVLYALDIEHVFQHEEEHVVVRYNDNVAPICECIPVSRIAGMRKEELGIE